MKHPYYSKSQKEKNSITAKIIVLSLLVNLTIGCILAYLNLLLFIFFPIAITFSIIAPFFDIPSLKENNQLIYYSSLFVAEREKNKIILVHGGSLFDYFFVIDRKLTGRERSNFILKHYLEGLLNLISEYETKDAQFLEDVTIKGTTYIINKRTAEKFGLKKIETDTIKQLILIYNYPNLICSISIARAKLSFPNLKNINTFEGKVTELIKNKDYLTRLYQKM